MEDCVGFAVAKTNFAAGHEERKAASLLVAQTLCTNPVGAYFGVAGFGAATAGTIPVQHRVQRIDTNR